MVKYTASGAEALLAMGPLVLRQMAEHVERAETHGTDEAKLAAYEALRQMITRLRAGE
ncbi:MAG: DUF6027 family protein [Anaerolineae bacterium]